MKRIAKISIIIIGVLGISVFLVFKFVFFKPMYEPKMVSHFPESVLTPPEQTDGDFWTMNDQIRLFHFSEGHGRNVVVVHGGPGFPFDKPAAGFDSLTNLYRFNYYDQRGCGKSSRPIDRFSSSNYFKNMKTLEKALGISSQLADIERIRRILGEDKLILAGHSFGAFLATLYAIEFPDHVEAMVLAAPANMLNMPQEGNGLFEDIEALLPPSLKKNYKQYLKQYFDFGSIFEKSETDLVALNGELVKYYSVAMKAKGYPIYKEQIAENGGWMVQAMYFSTGQSYDYRDAVRRIKVPVLVVHGSNDLQSEAVSRKYANLIPNSTFKVIKNSNHFVLNDTSGTFGKAVGDFFASLPKS